jgi:CelD/BcsL family acetyltransferase involved in cellulose biosynthesis
VETYAEFLALKSDWNRLLMQSSRPVPFLTWEWVSTWWEHFGNNSRLFVVVVRDEHGLMVGIAPLRITRRRVFGMLPIRQVEFLGYGGSKVCVDHLDFLTQVQYREMVAKLLIEEILRRQSEWDVLELADLAEESLIPGLLSQIGGDYGIKPVSGVQQQCPYIKLPNSWNSLLASLKKNYRNNIRRKREKLLKDFQVTFERDCSPEHVLPRMHVLERLHGSARNRSGEKGNFHLKEYRDFHRAVAQRMAQAGFLYLAQLGCNEMPVAALYGFHLGERFFGYQTGFAASWAPQGVGAVLQAMVIEDAIEQMHATEYDFLRGNEDYKYTWTSQKRHTNTVLVWRTALRARLAKAKFIGYHSVSSVRSKLRGGDE